MGLLWSKPGRIAIEPRRRQIFHEDRHQVIAIRDPNIEELKKSQEREVCIVRALLREGHDRSEPQRTARHGTATHGTATHGTSRHRTAPHLTVRHRTAPHRTAPHRTARHGTAPHRTAPPCCAAPHCQRASIRTGRGGGRFSRIASERQPQGAAQKPREMAETAQGACAHAMHTSIRVSRSISCTPTCTPVGHLCICRHMPVHRLMHTPVHMPTGACTT